MEKKAKIIATLGPAIYNETKLKQLVKLGVDAFRINFSHETKNIFSIVKRIRKVERSTDKKIALIADLQGVKLRVGKIKDNVQKIKFNQIPELIKDAMNNHKHIDMPSLSDILSITKLTENYINSRFKS